MKNYLVLGLALSAVVVLTGCKSKESAYRQAYERAKAQETVVAQQPQTQVVPVQTVQPEQPKREVVVVAQPTAKDLSDSDVRTIPGGFTVVNGNALNTFSVVVGSFITQANAEGQFSSLKAKGYDARLVKTNENINGHTGWFRVIASSFADKASAAQSRDELRASYPGAWLLYNK